MEHENLSIVSPDTFFAPAGRDTPDAVSEKQRLLARSPLLCETLNAIHEIVMVLNGHRQIVAANTAAFRVLNAPASDFIAKRPGCRVSEYLPRVLSV